MIFLLSLTLEDFRGHIHFNKKNFSMNPFQGFILKFFRHTKVDGTLCNIYTLYKFSNDTVFTR